MPIFIYILVFVDIRIKVHRNGCLSNHPETKRLILLYFHPKIMQNNNNCNLLFRRIFTTPMHFNIVYIYIIELRFDVCFLLRVLWYLLCISCLCFNLIEIPR